MWPQSQDIKSGTNSLACRGCLNSGVKLFNIQEHGLNDNYVTLVGITLEDNFTHHLCGICATMLVKFGSFRERCLVAYQLLMDAEYHEKSITKYIEDSNISTYSNQLTLPYTHTKIQTRNYVPLEYMNDEEIRIEVTGSDLSRTFTTFDLKKDNVTEVDVNKIDIEIEGTKEFDFDRKDSVIDNKAVKNENVDGDFDAAKVDTDNESDESTDTVNDKVLEANKKPEKRVLKKRPRTEQEILEHVKPLKFNVTFLNEEEQYAELEAKKANLQPNQCDLCGKKVQSPYMLSQHKKTFHDIDVGKYECNICHWRLKNRWGFAKHMGVHKVVYQCTACPFKTKRVELLESHYLGHQGKIYTCEYCLRDLKTRTSYFSHVKMTHASVLPWCKLCGETFVNERGILNHKARKHRDVKVEFPCSGCGVKFSCESALDSHVRGECGLENCVQCGEGFQTDQLLRKHVVQRHNADIPMVNCEGCDVKFYNTKALQRHKQCCGSGVPCAQCGGHFDNDALMLEHVSNAHSDGTDCECVMCGKVFPNALNYKDHIFRMHNTTDGKVTTIGKEKRVRGPTAGSRRKPGNFKWGLDCEEQGVVKETPPVQKKVEMGVGTFICEVCGMGFKHKFRLTDHMLEHSGARPFKCPHCSKGFRKKFALDNHIRIHTGERPYKCETCLKTFKAATTLNKHKLIHTGERRHICQICNKSYSTSSSVKMHIKNVHLKIPYPKRNRKAVDC